MSTPSVMFDITGTELQVEERELLAHPGCCGVILFSRNIADIDQLAQLVVDIRSAARQDIVITIDQEGGRVQRIKAPLTRLPPLQIFGKLFQSDAAKACELAKKAASLMAQEIQSLGIDMSFAPVLDLDDCQSEVIGDRAFSRVPDEAITLGRHYLQGMRAAGMASTGKHFPGHGSVVADSHKELPVDHREKADIWAHDIMPFKALSKDLDAIMPAHVVYSACDDKPAGMSTFWLRDVLREELKFEGAIFSDDLDMAGAAFAGSYPNRAALALEAGCNIALICNNRDATEEILEDYFKLPTTDYALAKLLGKQKTTWSALTSSDAYKQLRTEIESLKDNE